MEVDLLSPMSYFPTYIFVVIKLLSSEKIPVSVLKFLPHVKANWVEIQK
jgi:hypothetical protein